MDIAQCSLAELVDDPLTGLVIKSDGVDRRKLELLLEQVASDCRRPGSQTHQNPGVALRVPMADHRRRIPRVAQIPNALHSADTAVGCIAIA